MKYYNIFMIVMALALMMAGCGPKGEQGWNASACNMNVYDNCVVVSQ